MVIVFLSDLSITFAWAKEKTRRGPDTARPTLPQVRSFISASVLNGVLKMGLWFFAADKEPRRLDDLIRLNLDLHVNTWKSNACYGQRGSFRILWYRPPQASCTRLLPASRLPTKWPLNGGGFEIKGGESGVVQIISRSPPLSSSPGPCLFLSRRACTPRIPFIAVEQRWVQSAGFITTRLG